MTLTAAEIDRLPHVPISTFKSNPAHYLKSGAAVTTHGRVSAAFIPVSDDTDQKSDTALEAAKARLRLLARLADDEVVTEELERLTASRDTDMVGEPR
ncbi:hypothetical protein [Leifsonia shinshuensis]|uniref:Type II toxin-antitoxin system Phd/YefM family antitoxin n=1 Tax=Leifsonia shinshuensis TaxID=150026 RepID=A0A7G6YG04_9MICO|nr:hypothetical protein [Leifsonia shinshuensis]QNE37419.1 hypothetical protein F1C12_21440 [Leifsonia shinshuensis]